MNEIKIQTANTIRVLKVEDQKDKYDVTFKKSVLKDGTEEMKVHAQLVCVLAPEETYTIKEDFDVLRDRRFPADTRRSIEKQINEMLTGEIKGTPVPVKEVPKAAKPQGLDITVEDMSKHVCDGFGGMMLELRKEFKTGEVSLGDVVKELELSGTTEAGLKNVTATKKPFGFTYEYKGEARQFYFGGRGKNAVIPSTRVI